MRDSFTKNIVKLDILINLATGIILLLAPKSVNRVLFGQQALPFSFYAVIASGFLLFALWQLLFFIKPGGFTPQNLRLAALLSWIPALALAIGLVSRLGGKLLILPKVALWLANVYMVLLGGLYWIDKGRAAVELSDR